MKHPERSARTRLISFPKISKPMNSLQRVLPLCLLSGSLVAGEFPAPHDSEPIQGLSTPAEALASFRMPEGFQISLFAAEPEVMNPIASTWDHRGRLWVAENFTYAERTVRFETALRDRILVLEDRDRDGTSDHRKVFIDTLQTLTSVEVGRGGVWAMCPPQLLFIPDRNGDLVPDGAPEVVLDGFTVADANYHNFANGLRWGPDGWLYGRCGHSCPGNIGRPGTPDEQRQQIEGGIWRYHPDVGTIEVLTHGTTNPWGHDWDEHGQLFFINTVNGHLWHGIPGAHFKESFGADPNPGVYERLDMHADHWHFDTSGSWTASRNGKADAFGGGHAHVGMMIYQADHWPESFLGRLFTLNMHGYRANVERLERHGSGYLARHQQDVFHTSDSWFRGIDLSQGPDGSVYVLDWSDAGECHEHTGVHRNSGRIFRITHGQAPFPEMQGLESPHAASVARLVRHPNVWYSRQLLRRVDDWKHEGQHDLSDFIPVLHSMTRDARETTVVRLRALWILNRLGALTTESQSELLEADREHLRVWGIRFLTDSMPLDGILGPRSTGESQLLTKDLMAQFQRLAREDVSGLVRLTLASTLQRLPVAQRDELARDLASRTEDSTDHNMPSMVWYGIIPLLEKEPASLLNIAATTHWTDLQRWIARGLAAQILEQPKVLDRLFQWAVTATPSARQAVLQGTREGLEGWRKAPTPASWNALVRAVGQPRDAVLAALMQDLGALFGDGRALARIREVALDNQADFGMRKAALETLIENRPDDLRQICESLINTRHLNSVAIKGLALYNDASIGELLASRFKRFYPPERPAVMEILVSRPDWAASLLKHMGDGRIERSDLSAFQARQIRALGREDLSTQLARVWGEVRESDADKKQLMADLRRSLTRERLASANLANGRQLFNMVCASCHVMYGEGGKVGPDLTGSGRADLDYLIENIADPGAVVSADYRMITLEHRDGRVLTGIVSRETPRTLHLMQATGEIVVEKSEVLSREVSQSSMMPDGLLTALNSEQVRDLIAYLQYPRQIPLPAP